MNKTVSKYFNAFRTAELNKSTDDVKADLQQLQLKPKIKYYGFYTATILFSAYIYSSGLSFIKSDKFRADLIEQAGVAPFNSLFYSDFTDEYKKADKEITKLSNELTELQKDRQAIKGFYYPQREYLKDIKSGKVNVDLKFDKKSIEQYQKTFIQAYLLQHGNENIELNGHKYTIQKIISKIGTMGDRESAYAKLDLPAKAILQKINADINDDNVALAKEALFDTTHLTYQNRNFLAGVKLKDFNPTAVFKKAVLNGNSSYRIRGGGYYSQTIKIPSIYKSYLKHKKELKVEYDANLASIKAKAKIAKKKIATTKEKIKDLQHLKSEIGALKIDVANYKEHKEKVEKLLDKGVLNG